MPTISAAPEEPYAQLRLDLTRQLIFSYAEKIDPGKSATLLKELRNVSPRSSEVWEQLLPYWDMVNKEGFVNASLPDGLPDDNSLCIVILGYGLNADGSMREELVSRLQLGLSCANQYPNAYVLVSGGATAAQEPNATEADAMAQWLTDQGLASPIIIENQSKTSSENAIFSYEILRKNYPEVKSIAIVSSNYHVPLGCLLFQAQFWFGQQDSQIAPSGSKSNNQDFFKNLTKDSGSQPAELAVIANAGADVKNSAVFDLDSQASWLWNLVSLFNHK